MHQNLKKRWLTYIVHVQIVLEVRYVYIPLTLGFLVFDFFLVGNGVSEWLDRG